MLCNILTVLFNFKKFSQFYFYLFITNSWELFLALFQIISPGVHQMALQEVELTTSGRFMCQITMDSPPFEFVEDGGRLTVISLPERFPVISGNKGQTYTLGDWVDLNCTCFETYPAASIRWFINGKEVNTYNKSMYVCSNYRGSSHNMFLLWPEKSRVVWNWCRAN